MHFYSAFRLEMQARLCWQKWNLRLHSFSETMIAGSFSPSPRFHFFVTKREMFLVLNRDLESMQELRPGVGRYGPPDVVVLQIPPAPVSMANSQGWWALQHSNIWRVTGSLPLAEIMDIARLQHFSPDKCACRKCLFKDYISFLILNWAPCNLNLNDLNEVCNRSHPLMIQTE